MANLRLSRSMVIRKLTPRAVWLHVARLRSCRISPTSRRAGTITSRGRSVRTRGPTRWWCRVTTSSSGLSKAGLMPPRRRDGRHKYACAVLSRNRSLVSGTPNAREHAQSGTLRSPPFSSRARRFFQSRRSIATFSLPAASQLCALSEARQRQRAIATQHGLVCRRRTCE